jgi:hypothetical protein
MIYILYTILFLFVLIDYTLQHFYCIVYEKQKYTIPY